MSLSTISTVVSLIYGANQPAPMVFGALVLVGPEAPSRIMIGGKQAHTLHKQAGGSRIVDAMGADEGTLGWHGLFAGPAAAARARSVDAMRRSGLPVSLSFGDYQFTVLIVQFSYSYQDRGAVIAYSVATEILTNGSEQPISLSSLQSVLQDGVVVQQVLSSVQSTSDYYSAGGLVLASMSQASVAVAAASVAASIAVLQAQAPAGAPGLNSMAPVLAAGSAIATAIAGVPIGSFGVQAIGFAPASGAELAAAVVGAGALAGLSRAGGYLNRMSNNISTANGIDPVPMISA